MRKGLIGAVALLLGLAAGAKAGEVSYGGGVNLDVSTPVAKILAAPDSYVGKKVRIEGEVVEVCQMKGCWMELQEGDGGSALRVKVDDGVMVFPASAKGKMATAEGVVEAIPMNREEYVGWLRHLAEEKGEAFDPAQAGQGPYRILQLRGTGARIAGQ